jgi:hypothetical protein
MRHSRSLQLCRGCARGNFSMHAKRVLWQPPSAALLAAANPLPACWPCTRWELSACGVSLCGLQDAWLCSLHVADCVAASKSCGQVAMLLHPAALGQQSSAAQQQNSTCNFFSRYWSLDSYRATGLRANQDALDLLQHTAALCKVAGPESVVTML